MRAARTQARVNELVIEGLSEGVLVIDQQGRARHANPAANAPLTGDRQAWEPRIQQGTDTLLDHAINGYNGMPPMGQCVECSEEQFLQLIGFMADQPLPQ